MVDLGNPQFSSTSVSPVHLLGQLSSWEDQQNGEGPITTFHYRRLTISFFEVKKYEKVLNTNSWRILGLPTSPHTAHVVTIAPQGNEPQGSHESLRES
jgi:hypothetical protein